MATFPTSRALTLLSAAIIAGCPIFFPVHGFSQKPLTASPHQLPGSLARILAADQKNKPRSFIVTVTNAEDFKKFLNSHQPEIKLVKIVSGKYFVVRTSAAFLKTQVITQPAVVFVEDGERKPVAESPVAAADPAVNAITFIHARYPGFSGVGLHISVKEDLFDTLDIDFAGRYTRSGVSSDKISTHATAMATIIAGGGNSDPSAKGAAWGATISGADFKSLLPDHRLYNEKQVSVQNHSYGVAIENYYGSDAGEYDQSVVDHPGLLHVFSAGNSGSEMATDGKYRDIPGFANLTGSFKMSKNTLTVGATNRFGEVSPLSSRGPAYDGRIKPDVVAYGESGTSEAAAVTSGISLLLQDVYQRGHNGQLPPAALLRAVLACSADDTGPKGIDFISGFGKVNAFRAFEMIATNRFIEAAIGSHHQKSFFIDVPQNAINLKITLAWTDAAAAPNTDQSLMNDLDLSVSHSTSHWLPWVLNSYPSREMLSQVSRRGVDTLNTIEQVTIDTPSAGQYTLTVKSHALSNQSQPFSIAYQWDTLQHYQWTYPAAGCTITGIQAVRWQQTFNDAPNKLAYSLDRGQSWHQLAENVTLASGYYEWLAPDTNSVALLRMSIGRRTFVSDTFFLSSPLQLHTGYSCGDSVLLWWKQLPGVRQYRVSSMDNQYLAVVKTVDDTIAVLQRKSAAEKYFTVDPVIGDNSAHMHATLDITQQGVSCYFKNFVAWRDGKTATLSVSLGTRYLVKQVAIQQLKQGKWQTLSADDQTDKLEYVFTDTALSTGLNTYRVKIILSNGTELYSDLTAVSYVEDHRFLIAPNPVVQGQPFNVISASTTPRKIYLIDVNGKTIGTRNATETISVINTTNLATGMYVLVVEEAGKRTATQKLLIFSLK